MRRVCCFLWLGWTGALVANSLFPVIESGDYILKFNRNLGSYAIYHRPPGGKRALDVLGGRDLRSNYFSLSVDGKLFTLGRDERYLEGMQGRLTLTPNGGGIRWKLPQGLGVTQYLRIITRYGLASYVKMDVVVDNTSPVTRLIGLFMLFDLDKADLGQPAFTLPEGEIYRESYFQGSKIPIFVRTSYDFYLYFGIRGASRPDRLVLGQWKKLHDAGWNYAFGLSNQGFGYNLYDSHSPALAAYYDPLPLLGGQSRVYTLYLSRQLLLEQKEVGPEQSKDSTNVMTVDDEEEERIEKREAKVEQPDDARWEEVNGKLEQIEKTLNQWAEKKEEEEEPNQEEEEARASFTAGENETDLASFEVERWLRSYHGYQQRVALLRTLQHRLEEEWQELQQRLAAVGNQQSARVPQLGDFELLIAEAISRLDTWDALFAQLRERGTPEGELARMHQALMVARSSLERDYLSWRRLLRLFTALQFSPSYQPQASQLAKQIRVSLTDNRAKSELAADLQRYSYGIFQRLSAESGKVYRQLGQQLAVHRRYLSEGDAFLVQMETFLLRDYPRWLEYREQAGKLMAGLISHGQQVEEGGRRLARAEGELRILGRGFESLEKWQSSQQTTRGKALLADPSMSFAQVEEWLSRLEQELEKLGSWLSELLVQSRSYQQDINGALPQLAGAKGRVLIQWPDGDAHESQERRKPYLSLGDKLADNYKQPIYPIDEDKLYLSLSPGVSAGAASGEEEGEQMGEPLMEQARISPTAQMLRPAIPQQTIGEELTGREKDEGGLDPVRSSPLPSPLRREEFAQGKGGEVLYGEAEGTSLPHASPRGTDGELVGGQAQGRREHPRPTLPSPSLGDAQQAEELGSCAAERYESSCAPPPSTAFRAQSGGAMHRPNAGAGSSLYDPLGKGESETSPEEQSADLPASPREAIDHLPSLPARDETSRQRPPVGVTSPPRVGQNPAASPPFHPADRAQDELLSVEAHPPLRPEHPPEEQRSSPPAVMAEGEGLEELIRRADEVLSHPESFRAEQVEDVRRRWQEWRARREP